MGTTLIYKKIDHPDFYYISRNGHKDLPVVLFDRNYFGKTLPVPFVKEEIQGMIDAVKRDLPNYTALYSWGGVGEVWFSVSIKPKKALTLKTKYVKVYSKQHCLPELFPNKLIRIK